MAADSNLHGLTGFTSKLAVVGTAKALTAKAALLGYISSGLVPRQLAVEPGGKVLPVTTEDSHQLQAIRIANIP